ncbi:PREDICTED: uncharacterized protein LOC106930827 [Poecilia mexicana]|uniref:uncharacterized protein LOC106930827 n=1 Tax=Poecilia mexicana TaxID=48701 RepID=UPI00072E2B9C|nr:PREDICTED: uncharacterized protein LOC106930827 [Poecilia mexicana]
MPISRIYNWAVLLWTLLALFQQPVTGLIQYSAAELLRLRSHLPAPPPASLLILDAIPLPRRKYIHRGSRRNIQEDISKPIKSIWSTSRRLRRAPNRVVDRSVLACLARSANTPVKSDNSSVNFGLLNIRSLTGKGHLIQDLLTDRKFDFLCLTETWQQPNDFSQLNDSTPPGFVYISQPRGTGRGGGLAVIHREKWIVSPLSAPTFSSFESTVCQLSGPTPTIITTIYRPPKTNNDFMNDFAALLTHLSILSPNIIILGDFNIHMDDCNSPLTKDFSSCLQSFGLQQLINFPTHSKGHVLDLVCYSGVSPSDCKADELAITDHFLLSFHICLPLSISKLSRLISFRNIKDINLNSLSSSVNSLIDNIYSTLNSTALDDLVSYYNTGLHSILNSLAPLKTRSVSFARSAPWFTPELRLMKAKGRQLDRLYRKTGLAVHKDTYKNYILHYKDCITQAKSLYYTGLICSNEGSTKSIFSLYKNISRAPDSLPSYLCSTDFCNSLMSFFDSKILKIHQQLSSQPFPCSAYELSPPAHSFSSFQLPTTSEITSLIHKSNLSTCLLDPLPTVLVKACASTIIPLISTIIHSSLSTGTVPASFKIAAITIYA